MDQKKFNVLFLCTGNSARSILAEALLKRWGMGKFNACSAGSQPRGKLHPMTVKTLQMNHFDPDGYRSKSWLEFADSEAPSMDFVFTVCDRAASEACPIWPGQPMSAHWGIADPDQPGLTGDKLWRKFQDAYWELDNRIKIFTALPIERLDKQVLQGKLDDIGISTLTLHNRKDRTA